MKVLVCGGRDFKDQAAVDDCLDEILCGPQSRAEDEIIQGAAKGADTCALIWAAKRGVKCISYPADWTAYGTRAGYIRNAQMLKEGQPDLVVAFPGGKGTAMMISLAKKAGVKVIDMGAKGSQTMTTTYSATDLRIMLNEAVLLGDVTRQKAIMQTLADEYDEIMQAQDLMEKPDGSVAK